MLRSRILSLGYYVPDNVVTNDDLSQRMDTSDQWIGSVQASNSDDILLLQDTVANMGTAAARMA